MGMARTVCLCVFTVTLLVGCSYRDMKNARAIQSSGALSFADIKENILTPRCLSCHTSGSAAGGLDASSYQALMNSGTVVAGNPAASRLYQRTQTGSMPPSGGGLSSAELELLYNWINLGAPENPLPPSVSTPQPTYSWISQNIFPRCIGCHNSTLASGRVNLSSYTSLKTSPGTDFIAVIPKNPNASGLYREVSDKSMPPTGDPLSGEEITVIRDWILNGAKND